MTDPRPSFSSLRFAVAPSRAHAHARARAGAGPGPVAGPAVPTAPAAPAAPPVVATRPLDLPRAEGLDLLDWLGLGRPEFGAISARELAPRCRRRLWDIERNAHASLRARTAELLVVAEAAGEGMVLFG